MALTPSLSHLLSKVSSPVVMGQSDPGLISRPSHLFSKVSSPFIGSRILLQLRCFKVAPKILYHHVHYGRDYCHWLHRKRKLRYTPRNPPPRFLCLELLRLSSLRLTAPPTSTLFGVFAFHHRRSPFITGVCTPSIRCLYNNSLSILACIGKVFACCLHQEHKRLPVVQTLTVSALSFIWEHFFSLHLLSHFSTSLDPTGTPTQSPCALVQFFFSRFLPIPCLCLTATHLVTTPIQVKIGCQSFLHYFVDF